jgi:hypothetical protein
VLGLILVVSDYFMVELGDFWVEEVEVFKLIAFVFISFGEMTSENLGNDIDDFCEILEFFWFHSNILIGNYDYIV